MLHCRTTRTTRAGFIKRYAAYPKRWVIRDLVERCRREMAPEDHCPETGVRLVLHTAGFVLEVEAFSQAKDGADVKRWAKLFGDDR